MLPPLLAATQWMTRAWSKGRASGVLIRGLGRFAARSGKGAIFCRTSRMVALAGIGNGIAQFWWTRSLSLAPPSAAVPFNYLSLVWATILGFAVWGDVPTPGLLVGSAIVVASGLYILWRETLRRRRSAVPAPQRA